MRKEYIERGEGTVILRYGPWASGVNFAAGWLASNDGRWYYCYAPHLSAAGNEPGVGASWGDYWEIWGIPGAEAYVYIAYASDDEGADFSLIPSAELHYMAVLNTNEMIESPEASDFAGLWQFVQGPTGDSGIHASRGDWADDTDYAESDWVYHAKSGYGKGMYRAKDTHHSVAGSGGNEPEVGSTWTDHWEAGPGGGADGAGTGDVIMDGTPAENKIIQQAATTKHVKGVLSLATTVSNPGSDSNIPTEQAVREALTAAVVGSLYQNAINNPQFQVNQRAAAAYTSATSPANNDDTYMVDQWVLLSDGNDIVDVSQETSTVPTSAPSCLKLEVETANKKFGIVQFIENKDALKFAGKTVSLQFKARTTSGKVIRHIRAAVLSWNGAADTLTSDVVSAWNAEGSNPTFAANWTAENTASDLTLVADTWTTYKSENINIDTASMANLAIFIWCDDADAAVDDLLRIGDVQLNEGAICLPFMPRAFGDDLMRCRRFYQKSYDYATAPGSAVDAGMFVLLTAGGACTIGDYIMASGIFSPAMRTGPSMAFWDYVGTIGKCTLLSNAAVGTDGITCTLSNGTFTNWRAYAQTTATGHRGVKVHWVASAEL